MSYLQEFDAFHSCVLPVVSHSGAILQIPTYRIFAASDISSEAGGEYGGEELSNFVQSSVIAMEMSKITSAKPRREKESGGGSKVLDKRKAKKKLNAAERTGFNYTDGIEEFDVPFIDEPRW